AYQRYAQDTQGNREWQDKYLSCAVVCCESALQVYSPDSYPVEYATTLVCLGQLHRTRPGGDRQANLEQACACYRDALHIFTGPAFPQDHHRTLLALRTTEIQLKALGQSAAPAPLQRG
ncbi:MAG: hypothetical protein J2P37_29955, partial [Ktedonobacteraceae bacterium]|nr:hypothetical protein [Ktedonobacteraceae bacterium]